MGKGKRKRPDNRGDVDASKPFSQIVEPNKKAIPKTSLMKNPNEKRQTLFSLREQSDGYRPTTKLASTSGSIQKDDEFL